MINIYVVPEWFFGYDIVLELIFAVVTLLVSYYAFKVYKLSGQDQPKLFGISFLLISLSYIIQSIFNFIFVDKLEDITSYQSIININILHALGVYSHILFFVLGLITLTYMTLKVKNIKISSLLFIIVLVALFFSSNVLYSFYLISSILLAYILLFYIINYWKNRQHKTILVLIAFAFLMFGNVHFIFSMNHSLYYVIGHLLGLIAYMLILANLVLVIRKSKKRIRQ